MTDINTNDDVIVIVKKILHHFEASFNIEDHVLFSSVSIGTYHSIPMMETPLIPCAKKQILPCIKPKRQGRNMFCFYTKEMNQDMNTQLKLQNDLKNAIKHNELVLHYQPQIDLKGANRIIGAEALLRWGTS